MNIASQPGDARVLASGVGDVVFFVVIAIIVIGLEFGKVMFDGNYTFKRMLRDIAVLAVIVGAITLVTALA